MVEIIVVFYVYVIQSGVKSTDACMSTIADRFQGIIKYDTDTNYTYQIVELVTTTTVNLD